MKSINSRRKFIRTAFNGILLSGMSPGIVPGFLKGCHSLPKISNHPGEDDLKRIQDLIANKVSPLKWIFTGDSITQGARHTKGYRSYPEIFAEHIRFEMNRSRDFIINTAISGHATTEILGDFEWRIRQFKPDVVSMMIGTNDAASSRHIPVGVYESNLRHLVRLIRELPAIPILHTPNTINYEENSGRERKELGLYVAAIRRICTEESVVLVDNWKHWALQKDRVDAQNWMADSLHPNGRGHLEIARLLFQTLNICDTDSFTCNSNIDFH
jgi:acyl-CoA thioesterase I